MPKPYFTLNLDVVGKPCLVVGGDEEALEKSERLHEAQADLTVVGRKCIPQLEKFCADNKIRLFKRNVEDSDIKGNFFVLNCVKTEPALSKRIYELCLADHAIISAYDQPDYSNAVMQALVRAGKMRIAIGSGGTSPGLAAGLRKELEKLLDQDFAKFSDWMAEQREKLIQEGKTPKERKELVKKMMEGFGIDGKISYPKSYRP